MKLKLSLYRTGQTNMAPGGWGSQKVVKVVSPRHRPPLTPPPRRYPWYSFLLEAGLTPRVMVRPEEISQWKIPMTPTENEPATSRVVEQCLNQLHHPVPPQNRQRFTLMCSLNSVHFDMPPPHVKELLDSCTCSAGWCKQRLCFA